MNRKRHDSVRLLVLLGLVACVTPSCHSVGGTQDPQGIKLRWIPPGPRAVDAEVSGPDAKIRVKVQYDPSFGDKTFLNSGAGLLARVYLIDPETEVAHWIPLSEVHIQNLVDGYDISKNDTSAPPHPEVEATLEFKTADHEGLQALVNGKARELILRLPFGVDSADAKEVWDAKTVPVTVTLKR